jgi:ATP-dependent Lon protease
MNSSKLPIIYLYKKIVFPFCNLTVQSRLGMLKNAKTGDSVLAYPVRHMLDLVFHRNRLATRAEIAEIKLEGAVAVIQVKGVERVRLRGIHRLFYGLYDPVEKPPAGENERLREELRKKSQELVFLINMGESDKLIHLLKFLVSIHQLTDFIANYFVLKFPLRYEMYSKLDAEERARSLVTILDGLIAELKRRR